MITLAQLERDEITTFLMYWEYTSIAEAASYVKKSCFNIGIAEILSHLLHNTDYNKDEIVDIVDVLELYLYL